MNLPRHITHWRDAKEIDSYESGSAFGVWPLFWPVRSLVPDLSFIVYTASAKTQGSKVSFRDKAGFLRTKESTKGLGSWRNQVADKAIDAYGQGRELMTGPLFMRTIIYRPPTNGLYLKDGTLSAKGKREPAPITRPDLLKQMRAIEDALTGVIYKDDSQICDHAMASRWGEPGRVEVSIWTPPEL